MINDPREGRDLHEGIPVHNEGVHTQHERLHLQNVEAHQHRCISWSAIVIGALVGMGLGFLLNLFSMAIGLSAFNATASGAGAIAIGGFLGLLIGTIVSMMTAGYAAGYLARHHCQQHHLGILYGFATWTLAMVFTAGIANMLSNHVASYTKNPSATVTIQADGSQNSTANLALTSPAAGKAEPAVQTGLSASTFVLTAFAVFLLFFAGALSSCLGACWGMGCKKHTD